MPAGLTRRRARGAASWGRRRGCSLGSLGFVSGSRWQRSAACASAHHPLTLPSPAPPPCTHTPTATAIANSYMAMPKRPHEAGILQARGGCMGAAAGRRGAGALAAGGRLYHKVGGATCTRACSGVSVHPPCCPGLCTPRRSGCKSLRGLRQTCRASARSARPACRQGRRQLPWIRSQCFALRRALRGWLERISRRCRGERHAGSSGLRESKRCACVCCACFDVCVALHCPSPSPPPSAALDRGQVHVLGFSSLRLSGAEEQQARSCQGCSGGSQRGDRTRRGGRRRRWCCGPRRTPGSFCCRQGGCSGG